jgi:hypothetical protein
MIRVLAVLRTATQAGTEKPTVGTPDLPCPDLALLDGVKFPELILVNL